MRGKGGEVEDVGDVERLSTAVGVVTPLFGAVEFAEEEVEERFVRLKIPIVEVCVQSSVRVMEVKRGRIRFLLYDPMARCSFICFLPFC